MIHRIFQYLQRVRNARRLGIPFSGNRNFRVPKSMRLGARTIPLSYPDEIGIRNDLLVCLIHDEYGLRQIRTDIRTIVDIGANVGFFVLAARASFPDAIIHAYEPNARSLAYLAENAAAANATVFGEAVGATEGWVVIEDSGDTNQARTSAATDGGVRQVALSEVVDRLGGWIDLAKIDCEGAEWEMLRDPAPWKRIGDVRAEYHLWGRHTYSELEEKFAALDFEIYLHHSAGEWGTVWARNRSRSPR